MITSPIKQYLYKMLILFPFTFLFAPIFYFLLPYRPHPESLFLYAAFPFLVYLWYAFFIYFGMTLAIIFKKYKYLVYPIIIGLAFLARYIAVLPGLDLQHTRFLADEFGEIYIIYIPVNADELALYMLILFITSALVGCFSAAYAKKTALEFLKRGNTFLFLHIAVIGGLLHGSVIYLGLFAASYFIARNFILINRELEVYQEKGVYNTGARRIIAYYFGTTLLFAIVPLIIFVIIMPRIINHTTALIGAILMAIGHSIAEYERDLLDVSPEQLPDASDFQLGDLGGHEQLDELLVYNFLLITALIVTFLFRKAIWRSIKELIALLRTKSNLTGYDKSGIINEEIITEAPKEKEKKGKAAYNDYLKKLRGIADSGKRFLFMYNCLHWELVKKGSELKESLTPHELAEIAGRDYTGLSGITDLYQDIKYGDIRKQEELLNDMTEKTKILLKQAAAIKKER